LEEDFSIRTANPAFHRAFETTPERTLGRTVLELLGTHESAPEVEELLDGVVKEGRGFRGYELSLDLEGSDPRTLVLNGRRLAPLPSILLGIRDVTRERRLTERLHQTQKQKMEAVARLSGGIGHDFNNLLTSIEGHATLVLDQLSDESTLSDHLQEILAAGRRAGHLTDQLLAFSREQVQQKQNVELGATTLAMKDSLRGMLPEHIQLRMEANGADPVVRVDASQLHQVILNLVLNAAEATDQAGSISVVVDAVEFSDEDVAGLSEHVEPGLFGRVSVRDNGRGIDPESLTRIFEPFFTTKDPPAARGLGLATAFGIVNQSNGDIRVKSDPGRGSIFEIILPRVEGDPDPHGPDDLSRVLDMDPDGQTVLLAEDDAAVRDVLGRILEGAGYGVLHASDGREALSMLRAAETNLVRVVLSDIVMPDMGGIELARQVRKDRPDIPIVLMSGHAREALRDEIEGVSNAFLAKPCTRSELLQCIADVLASTRS